MNYRYKWLVFIGLALSVVLVDVDMTAINLIATNITKSLAIPFSTTQWIIDGYTIAAASLMAFAGSCADIFGPKKIFQWALLAFVAASLAVGLSQGAWSISISRIFQGACIAFTFPISIIIAQSAFPDNQRGLVMGLLISIAGAAQALGPTIGGIIIHFASWRWLFFINIPLALIALLLIHFYFPVVSQRSKRKIRLLPLIMLIIGLFALITALNEIARFGLFSFEFIGLLIIAICSMSWFVYHEFHTKNPLLGLKLLINHAFATLISLRLLINFVYFSWLFLISLLLQHALGYSAFATGLVMLSLTLIIAVLSAPVGRLIDDVGSYKPLVFGLLGMLLASILLAIASQYHGLVFLCLSLLVAGVATALLIPANATACMQTLQPEKAGVGMGVLFTSGFIGSALGIAIQGSIVNSQANFFTGFFYCMVLDSFITIGCLSLLALLLINFRKKHK